MLRHLLSLCAVLAAVACNTSSSAAQVDPYWLRSWEKAQETRPRVMASSSRIAPANEPGTPLVVRGKVIRPDGRTPAEGVVVHAYHRDTHGFDFGPDDKALPTWRLQGWAVTDREGSFEFRTIRPAPDHLGREAAHIHFTLDARESGRQWAPTLFLADDPLVTARQRTQSAAAGEFGWVQEVSMSDGVGNVAVRIRLKAKGDF